MRTRAARVVVGVLAGYLTNAVLVGVTEAIYANVIDKQKYFVVDLITQIIATIIGASVCCLLAQQHKLIAATVLTVIGLTIGTASAVMSWNEEPHWYAIALLVVYAPCVLVGYTLTRRLKVPPPSV